MKVLFFLTSRYPTHKAYGVTTGETASALRELGNIVKIVAPTDINSYHNIDEYNNEIVLAPSTSLIFFRRVLLNLRILGSLVFVLTSLVFTLRCARLIKAENPDVLWVRDYWSALILRYLLPDSKIIVEVHQTPSFANHLVLNAIGKDSSSALLTIQESLREELKTKYPSAKVYLGPMGASDDFFRVGRARLHASPRQLENALRVCFVGRMASSGRDNGIFQLLNDWRNVPNSIANLTLIGFSEHESERIRSRFPLENVNLLPSLKHLDIPHALSQFDCGLVPYPEGEYHRTRFPIKIVEYCASGLNVIANDTLSNRELLSDKFTYFYRAGDTEGLLGVLKRIKESVQDSQRRAEKGFMWAQDYTYRKRLAEVYPFLEGRKN